MKKRMTLLAMGILSVGMAVGAIAAESDSEKRTIGIATYTLDNSAIYPLLQGMIDGVTQQGDDYVLVSANGSDDTEGIVQSVEELVNRDDIDGLLIDNINDTVLNDVVAQAAAKGIPCVFNDIAFAADEDHPIVANVLNDNYAAGETVARQCAEDLEGKGNVILFAYWGNEACRPRSQAIYDVFDEYPDLSIVYEGMVTLDVAKANSDTEDLLMAYPDVDAIISIVDNGAIGAVSAIKAQARDGIKVYGIDGSADICPLIKSGDVVMSAGQDFTNMGLKSAEVLYSYLNGEEVEDEYMVDIQVIDSSNVDEWIDYFQNTTYTFAN